MVARTDDLVETDKLLKQINLINKIVKEYKKINSARTSLNP